MILLELLKALLYGLVEGITEWLPVSSTGHLILLGQACPLAVSEEFSEVFDVVIQLGAIMAVVLLYFSRLNPFSHAKSVAERRRTRGLWLRVGIAVLPSAILGFLLDDWLDAYLFNPLTVAVTLVVYGVLFLLVERRPVKGRALAEDAEAVDLRQGLGIGLFQVLALIPGTSRSGATILGAMLLGCSRGAAAEFSFFLAIPTMLGAGGLKVIKLILSDVTITPLEWGILAVGCLSAFLVSLAVIRFLTDFVRRHSFAPFGLYRLILGLLVAGSVLLGVL